jgi:hypothetical protein
LAALVLALAGACGSDGGDVATAPSDTAAPSPSGEAEDPTPGAGQDATPGGDDEATSGGGSDGSPGPAGGGPAGTELTISVSADEGAAPMTYALTCDPPGGDHPNPQAACETLGSLEAPFALAPAGALCTQVYGGPQTATVTGTLDGEEVTAMFSRTDGCEIARWDSLVDVLIVSGGVDR